MKEFTIKGIEGTNCDGLLGISLFGDATLKLDSAIIKDCTFRSVFVGTVLVPGQSGHTTITHSVITDYQNIGVFAVGDNSTLKMSYNKIVGSAPDALAITGIIVGTNATGTITNNEVSGNICDIPDICGPDWFNQFQAFGIVADTAGEGTVIANNYLTNNDAGISVFAASGCCIVDYNKLKDNRFFGIVIEDSEHTVSNTKIFGGKVGAAAAATFGNTTATLDKVKIVGAEIPIQALSSGNLTAAVNVLSPSFFQP
jgi:parallel beta-helix repeat protein